MAGVSSMTPATVASAASGGVEQAETLDVTVVLPIFNEKGHVLAEIERTRAALDASPYSYELLVIDDGSSDGSPDLVRPLITPDGPIRMIVLPENRGSGTARRIGTANARGRVVVWTDVDMTYPNDQVPWLVDQLDGWDHVVGARTSEQGTHKAFRVPAKWFIRKLASYLSETKIPDLNSGFRAFRRQAALPYLHTLPKGFSCVTTITMAHLANGYSVRYVPIDYKERAGTSKFHWWRDTKRYLLQVVRMILSYNPLRVFLPIGLFFLVAGIGKGIFDLIDKSGRINTNTIVLLLAGFQVLMTGLLADLIVRQTKPRMDDVGRW
jgi:polyisoprenyl-phosphate glycosyltransferase